MRSKQRSIIAKAAEAATPDRQRKRLGEAVAPLYRVGEVFGDILDRVRLSIRFAVSQAFATDRIRPRL